jgi:hypothetical protein
MRAQAMMSAKNKTKADRLIQKPWEVEQLAARTWMMPILKIDGRENIPAMDLF